MNLFPLHRRFSLLVLSVVITLTAVLLPQAGSAQSRTPWQMHTNGGPICFPVQLKGHGDPDEYTNAPAIPSPTDPLWSPAPNPNIINYSASSTIGNLSTNACPCLVKNCGNNPPSGGGGCAGDFTFFQTFVYIPLNATVTNFSMIVSNADDGARITLFNSNYPAGLVLANNYVFCCGQSTSANLAPYATLGETNRIVITLVDDKCTKQALSRAEVIINAGVVTITNSPPVAICTNRTVTLGPSTTLCFTNLFIDNGSFDPNGDPTNIVYSPPPPYGIGTRQVTLTITDNKGASNSCSATVTVIDAKLPVIDCPPDRMVDANPGQCLATFVGLGVPNVSECSGFVVSSNAPFSFPAGTNFVVWTATDTNGNTSSCTQKVVVRDLEGPAITCPADILVNSAPGLCTSNVIYGFNLSDNCGVIANVGVSYPSGTTPFPIGTTPVTVWAVDDSGNSNSCSFNVTVQDRQSPNIVCPSNIVVAASPDQCASNVTFNVSAADNCDGPRPVVSVPPSGFAFPVGTTTVTSTASDTAGNSNTCTFTVTVVDTQPPVVTCPSNFTVFVAPGTCYTNFEFALSVTASDNCGGFVSRSSTPPTGFPFPVGTTMVTNWATDDKGNSNYCTLTVTVLDNIPPSIACPPDVTVTNSSGTNVAFNVPLGTPLASDNCTLASVTSNAPAFFPTGTNIVTWTATDAAGNTNSCTQRVIVGNSAPPVIACPSDIIVPAIPNFCFATGVSLGTPTVTFPGCGGVIVSSNGVKTSYNVGTNLVTWSAQDQCGNIASCQQRVIVIDTQPPSIMCPNNLVLGTSLGRCDRTNVTYTIPASDNCDDQGVGRQVQLLSGLPSGATFPKGTTTNSFRVVDRYGNTNFCSFTITINDFEPPALICPSNIFVNANFGGGATGIVMTLPSVPTDNCGVASVVSNAPSFYPAGTNAVTFTVTDSSGNTNTCVCYVIVFSSAPALACPADVIVPANVGGCFATGVNLGTPVVSNGCTVATLTNDAPASFPVGTNIVTWTVTDTCGRSASCTQKVVVLDNQPPAITCPGNIVLPADPGRCSRSNVVYAITATDNCSATTIAQLAGLSSGSTFPVGITTNRFRAMDSRGNTNICSFTVTIVDTQPPQITCPPDVTASTAPGTSTAINVPLGSATANDNCGLASLVNNAGVVFPVGTNFVTWTAMDVNGNSTSCTQRVIIQQTCVGNLVATPLGDQIACPCGVASFETAIGSFDPVTIVWKRNGQVIPGATNSSLRLYSLKPSDAGQYTVEVRNFCDMVTSSATLTLSTVGDANPIVSTNPSAITIFGFGAASPYPAVIPVECVQGLVSNLTVTIHGFTHRFPSDVSALLVSPDGKRAVKLMGGTGDGDSITSAINLTFSDSAPEYLPEIEMLQTGTYKPTDYRPQDSLFGPAPSAPYATNLAAFNGTDPNGGWKLYILDDAPGDSGNIFSGWSLSFNWQPAEVLLVNPQASSNGIVTATVIGVSGMSYLIEGSTDLATWVPLSTNVIGADSTIFIDTQLAPNPYRYYRIQECACLNCSSATVRTVFLPPQWVSNGVFRSMVQIPAGVTNVIQGSTNLIHWTPVSTNVGTASPAMFMDTQSPQFRYRFYRAAPYP